MMKSTNQTFLRTYPHCQLAHDCIYFDRTFNPEYCQALASQLIYQLKISAYLPHCINPHTLMSLLSVNGINMPLFVFCPQQLSTPFYWPFKTDPKQTTTLPQTVTCHSDAVPVLSSIITLLCGVRFSANWSTEDRSCCKSLLQRRVIFSILRYSDGTWSKPRFTIFLSVCLILGICTHGFPFL